MEAKEKRQDKEDKRKVELEKKEQKEREKKEQEMRKKFKVSLMYVGPPRAPQGTPGNPPRAERHCS